MGPVAITRHVVETTLTAQRVCARYVATPAANDAERSTLLEQLRPGTRVEITSEAFVGTLDARVIESGVSGIELVDRDGLAHFIVWRERERGWRLRRYECVDVRFEVEILCGSGGERSPEDTYAMILAQALSEEDLADQLSGYAYEIAKKAVGAKHVTKLSGDVDESRICAAVVFTDGTRETHVLVNLVTGDSYVALTGGV